MAITAALVKELRERTGAGMMACKKALVETNGNIETAIDNMRKNGEAKAAKRAAKVAAEGVVKIASSADNKKAVMIEVNCETDFVGRDGSFVGFVSELADFALAANAQDPASIMNGTNPETNETFEVSRQQLVAKIGENIQLRRVCLIEAQGVVGHYSHGERIGVLVALDKNEPELAKDIAMHIAAMKPEAISSADVPQALVEREKAIFTAQAEQSGKPTHIIEKMIGGRINKYLKEISLLDQAFVKNPDQTIAALLKTKNATVSAFKRYEVGDGIVKVVTDFAQEVMAQVKGE